MTKMGCRSTELKKGIKPISDKQRIKNAEWKRITDERCEELDFTCEYCGKQGQRADSERFDYLDGHHIIRRSRGRLDTKENCYPCHRVPCHSYITDHNVAVKIGDCETRKYWI